LKFPIEIHFIKNHQKPPKTREQATEQGNMNINQAPTIFLNQPILYINDLPPQVSDQDIISVLHECLRARLRINRTEDQSTSLTGTVEFEKLENGMWIKKISR
jgi:hypothetical protein